MSRNYLNRKNPAVDLRLRYRKTLEYAFVASLSVLIFVFYSFRSYETGDKLITEVQPPVMIVYDVPITVQLKRPPKPTPPSFPVPVDDLEMAEAVTIDFGSVDVKDLLAMGPPPKEKEEHEFFAVEQQPKLIKKVKPYYPEIAQKAGIEGDVVLKVLVGKKGDVEKVELIKSTPMFDEAAMKAAWKCKFKPGKQRDKFVRVWFSIPFKFKLR